MCIDNQRGHSPTEPQKDNHTQKCLHHTVDSPNYVLCNCLSQSRIPSVIMEAMAMYHFHSFACVHAKLLSVMSNSLQPYGLQPIRLLCPWNSPGKNPGVGCPFLLQGIFLTQASNPHLLRWQADSLEPPGNPSFLPSAPVYRLFQSFLTLTILILFYRLSFSWVGLMVSS